MRVTVIYPDGTTTEEELDTIPEVRKKIGTFVVARVEPHIPGEADDTIARVYLQKAEE